MSKAKEINSNQTLAIVVFFGLTAALAAVFLSSRGADVGRLSQLLGNLLAGDLFGAEGFLASALGLLIGGLIFAAWYGLEIFLRVFLKKRKLSLL